MRRTYIDKTFNPTARRMIATADRICQEFAAQRYDLTLRQLYYQFVANDLFPDDRTYVQTSTGKWVKHPEGTKNAEPNYKWLGDLVNDGRLAGMLDWSYIVDRTRSFAGGTGSMSDPSDAIKGTADYYRIDKWADQENHVEVWIEKEALAGVLQRACPQFEVVQFSCRGYASSSSMWRAAQRLGDKIADGRNVRIVHLGDHDPSGIDMTRDISHRLATFIGQDLGYTDVHDDAETAESELWPRFEVQRIALTMDQIREFNPPPNPAKVTDSRAASYIARYGRQSWELDALPPATLVELIGNAVESHRDRDAWDAKVEQENREKAVLVALEEHWDDVQDYIETAWPVDDEV